VKRIAPAYVELMRRLGYERFGAHGGDLGALTAREIGLRFPEQVIGVHLTMLPTAVVRGEADLAGLTGEELALAELSLQRGRQFQRGELGYAMIQGSKPQTLAYGLTDSPVGQLAWIAEKFEAWSDGVDREDLLTTVMLYWLTRTANSSARIYTTLGSWGEAPQNSTAPTGVAVFPHDTARPVRFLAERTEKIVRWTEFDRGGHFPALEQPDLVVADLRALFRDLS
jgi:pimeloyl-ACP methyl ester carboxylesterase